MLSRRVRTTLSILTLCGAMGFALVTSHAPSDSLNAQSSHSVAADPELFSGTAQPASTRAVSNPLKSFDGRVTIAELKVENGQSVEVGQLLAVLELSEFEARLKAARTSVEEAHFNLEKAEVALNHERETREYNIAKAKMDVEAAERKLKFFKEFDKEDSIEKGRQRVENAENSIEDQEDELKQLRKLYGKNELATESQDIVLRRSERRLEVSKKNLKIVKNEFKVLREVTIPAEEWRLPFEVRKAVRALEKARIDKRDALEKKEEELQKARKVHEAARKKIEEMEADRERLEVKAPAAGTVIFGDLSDAKSFDGGIKQGAGVKLRQTLFTVADMNTMRAEISVPVAQRASLLENGAGKVNDLDAKVTGVGLIANGKSVRAMIEIDANGRLLIGQEVTFKR